MTKKQANYKTALIRQVHLSKRYINYYKENDSEYRELLKKHFGVDSSKKLSIAQLKELVDYLNHKSICINVDRISDNQSSFLLYLWEQNSREKDFKSLLNFVKRLVKREINNLDELTKREAYAVITGVKTIKNIKPAQKAVNNIY